MIYDSFNNPANSANDLNFHHSNSKLHRKWVIPMKVPSSMRSYVPSLDQPLRRMFHHRMVLFAVFPSNTFVSSQDVASKMWFHQSPFKWNNKEMIRIVKKHSVLAN